MKHHKIAEPDNMGYNIYIKCRICFKESKIINTCNFPLFHFESEV